MVLRLVSLLLLGSSLAASSQTVVSTNDCTRMSPPRTGGPTPEQTLVSAKKVVLIGGLGYVAANGIVKGMNPSEKKAQEYLEKEIGKWGRFTVIDDPAKADLVLVLFEGNRSQGRGGVIRTAMLVVFPGGPPPKRGDIPIWRDDENGGALIPTTAAPKVVGKLRSHIENLEKTTAHVDLTVLCAPAPAPSASVAASTAQGAPGNAEGSGTAQAPVVNTIAAAQEEQLPPRPEKYFNPLEVIAKAKTYTIRGSGGEGGRSGLDKHLGIFGREGSDVHESMGEIFKQMTEWGRLQYVDEVTKADITILVDQWDENAGSRYSHVVKSVVRVAEGGVAFQRHDPSLWGSGTQLVDTKHMIDLLRTDVEHSEQSRQLKTTETANKEFERGSKQLESGLKKKYESEKQDECGEAILHLRRSLYGDYDYAPAHKQLGRALRELNYNLDAAFELKLALAMQPEMHEAMKDLALALGAIPDWDEAIKTAQEYVRIEPKTSSSYETLGQVRYWKKEYPAAAEAFREAVKLEPTQSILHQKLGRALYRDKRYVEAESAFREALRLNENDDDSMTWLGGCLNEQRRFADALPFLRKSVEKDKWEASTHHELGRSLAGLKQFDEAIAELNTAIKRSSDTVTFHIDLAHILAKAGKNDEALAKFREIVSNLPKSPSAHSDLGVQLLAMSKTDEAEKELQKAIELDGKCAQAYFHLGRLRESKGDATGAKTAFDTARSIEPENEEFKAPPGSKR
jgi:tetratricopeptide (TPR) repeat protein